MIRDWSNFIGGRTAIVTGAGAGVGRAIAIQMARAGATVWVNDLYLDRAEKVVGEIESEGLQGRAIAADVTELDAVREMRDRTGPIDIVVNNAGSGVRFFGEGKARLVSFVESKPDEWEPVMRVNLAAVFYVTHTREQTGLLATFCGERGLLTTGSADFHSPDHPRFHAFRAFELHGYKPELGPIA